MSKEKADNFFINSGLVLGIGGVGMFLGILLINGGRLAFELSTQTQLPIDNLMTNLIGAGGGSAGAAFLGFRYLNQK